MGNNKISVLHVASDYPDGSEQISTQAVKNLIEATSSEIDSFVVSIRRVNKLRFYSFAKDKTFIVTVPRIPGGFFCSTFLLFAAIVFFLKYRKALKNIDIVHGHKLTIDGVFAYAVSKLLQNKLVISIRGTSDIKFFKWKMHTRYLYKRILGDSEHLFFVSMWCLPFFKTASKKLSDPEFYSQLANICEFRPLKHNIAVSNKFLFVGSLDNASNKGLFKIIDCIAVDKKFSLDIFGAGNEQSTNKILAYINKTNTQKLCLLRGKQTKEAIYSQSYIALVLPSYPETFGMVFVEALMTGIPVIGSSRSGIAGYLEAATYARFIDDRNLDEIYQTMVAMEFDCKKIKQELYDDVQKGKLDLFRKQEIVLHYIERLKKIL